MGFLLTPLTLNHFFFSSSTLSLSLSLPPPLSLSLLPLFSLFTSLCPSFPYFHWSSFFHSVFNSKVYTKDYTLTPYYYLVTAAYALEQWQRITNSTDFSNSCAFNCDLFSLSLSLDTMRCVVCRCWAFVFMLRFFFLFCGNRQIDRYGFSLRFTMIRLGYVSNDLSISSTSFFPSKFL